MEQEKCPQCGYILDRKEWGKTQDGKQTVRVVCLNCGYERGIEVEND
jgi:predicted RNA-binding Zn-ribbon protein involved in translation (DUF1610 family)